MKCKTKGDSTVIVFEAGDYSAEAERRSRDREILDKGGEVVVCSENGECRSFSRVPKDYRIPK